MQDFPLRVRLAALFHDLGKPVRRLARHRRPAPLLREARRLREAATSRSARSSPEQALDRLRYPTELRKRVVRIVRSHMIDPGKADPLRARRLLARYGAGLLFDLLDHKEADLRGKGQPADGDLARGRPVSRRRARGAGQPASSRRPRRRRRRPDRARLSRRGLRSARRCRRCCTRWSTNRSCNTREALLERAKELAR